AEVAGADDGDAQFAIEAQNLTQVALEVADVIADATHTEFAEVGEVLADLGRIEVELVGQRLRRDRPDPGALEQVETAQVNRQAVGGELGNLVEALPWLRRLRRG